MDAYRPLPPYLRRGAKSLPRGGRSIGWTSSGAGIATTLTDYVSAYAATHPQEDFAETFRFYVARRGRLRELFAEFGRKRKGVRLYEKFLVLHELCTEA